MATAKTRDFELFDTITANAPGSSRSLDLNEFVDVADMEAFGIESIEIGIDATETTPETAVYLTQVALEDLSGGFISHASYNSLYTKFADVPTGYSEESLSLGDVKEVRYVPGGTIYMRADQMGGATSSTLYIRITGKIATLSAKDYMALALTKASN